MWDFTIRANNDKQEVVEHQTKVRRGMGFPLCAMKVLECFAEQGQDAAQLDVVQFVWHNECTGGQHMKNMYMEPLGRELRE